MTEDEIVLALHYLEVRRSAAAKDLDSIRYSCDCQLAGRGLSRSKLETEIARLDVVANELELERIRIRVGMRGGK